METQQSPEESRSTSQAPPLSESGSQKPSAGAGAAADGKANGTQSPPKPKISTFAELYATESEKLDSKGQKISFTVDNGIAGEPWVTFTSRDRFGLAFSGGGIRSATFNLGLAQALAHLGVLKEVDYLSTVSGGGYVGGFWMAWLQRNGRNAECFPLGNDQSGGERAEIRHLREFSRFLLPRVGVAHTEFWGIVMTVLGGLVPSLLAAIAMLFIFWSAWVTITGLLLRAHPVGATALGIGLAAYLLYSEWSWARARKSEHNIPARTGYVFGSLLGAGLITAAAWFWPQIFLGLPSAVRGSLDFERFFAPALLLAAGTLVLLVVRVIMARYCRSRVSVSRLEGFERAASRFLAMTVLAIAAGALWWVAGKMTREIRIPAATVGAVGSAALFAWAKKWLMSPVEETHGSSLLRTAINHLKRATPKLLASLTWLLLFLLVGAFMQYLGVGPLRSEFAKAPYWEVIGIAATILLLTAWLFDPARVGMHEFYRSRISRCYLGASNIPKDGSEYDRAAHNRYVIERTKDDLTLKDLGEMKHKPVHLICTAANDISGDPLGTLYRGARSAVLSGNGITIGDETAPLDHLRLSSALTASAAAFNSHMGRLSIDLGPAVTFLMSALNLRLGLWVQHPKNSRRDPYLFPGRFFLKELLGQSRADKANLLLSDGNHFENFGLYELIRRHTRYIIVSDCGADPDIAFDDLANVLRRVREDFGVEIDLDISALRRGENGLARQHAVVGTIHYNGIIGMDKGTIIFFKPALTGDEPPDVLQYRTRNHAFPHESTGDQFYDEPQWESYRRLGEHAARTVLAFIDEPQVEVTDAVDRLFNKARWHWPPAPDRQQQGFLEMTERFIRLEADLLANGPHHLRAEVFSEITELAGTHLKPPNADEEMAIFSFLLRVMQMMEDVWLCADLEHYWSHPLNQGWMNYFYRWSCTPSFRRWWPILGPMYSLGFREFAKDRFGVAVQDKSARPGKERSITAGQLQLSVVTNRTAFRASRTWQSFQQRHADFNIPTEAGITLFQYELDLLGYDGQLGGKKLLVGFAIVKEQRSTDNRDKVVPAGPEKDVWTADWQSSQLYIPQALQGGGMLARLLDAVIEHYKGGSSSVPKGKFVRLNVHFTPEKPEIVGKGAGPGPKPKILSRAAREQRVQDIEFYKSRGFNYVKAEKPETGEITLTLSLQGSSDG